MDPSSEPTPILDQKARDAVHERHRALASGLMALPNLYLRSAATLTVLYGMLSLVLIAIVQFGYLRAGVAVAIGCGIIVLQFVLGPWIMDLMLRFLYKMRWVQPDELPEHLRSFVGRVCEEERMRFPSFGIIDDGAPQAFTYGHHPSNARIVISRGLMEMLQPGELDAVVAHEIGHARNWDMALMTVANLVPLLLFYLYDLALRVRDSDDKAKAPGWAVAIGAYVLYVISEYIVLWFSRTREYYADRFAGMATGDPNALARALVKIAYGLAAQESQVAVEAGKDKDKAAKKSTNVQAGAGAWGALNIFDRKSAVTLVMSSAGTDASGEVAQGLDVERVKGAMQWDLWNPWATWFELNSTHPLTAKRLQALGDHAAALDQKPLVVFDRQKPESYWDDFLVDVVVMMLPVLGILAGLGVFVGMGVAVGQWQLHWLLLPLVLVGLGSLIKTLCSYRGKVYPHLTVASLLSHVKVSPVRPVPTTLTGTIIGKGVPGLVFSEDFVIRDKTGILFLDYKQPLAIWNFFFGLLRAERYQGKEVRVTGWFRRAPVPYLEIYKMEVVDGSEPSRTCYSYHVSLAFSALIAVAGVVGMAICWGKQLF